MFINNFSSYKDFGEFSILRGFWNTPPLAMPARKVYEVDLLFSIERGIFI